MNQTQLADLPRHPAEAATETSASVARAVPHPALRWKTRILLPGIVLLSALLLLLFSLRDALQPAVTVTVVPVVEKAASGEAVTGGGVVAQAPGWVEPWPFAVSAPALADGIIEELLVLEGQAVEAGQVLARLIDTEARIALAEAEAEVQLREAELAAAEVAAGQGRGESATALSISTELAASASSGALAEARLEQERLPATIAVQQARLDELQSELASRVRAAEQGLIASVQVDVLRARVRGQEAELASLGVQERILDARVKRLEVEVATELARARALLASAGSARDAARLQLERMTVRAPADGVVLMRNVEPGSMVSTSGPPVVRLYDPHKLQVRVDVPLSSAARVGVGQEAEVIVDVLPEQVFRGQVVRVIHEADIQRNTLQFKVLINDPSPLLKPEMLARVRFLSPQETVADGQEMSRLFAPVAVVGSVPGSVVTVHVADLSSNVARRRSITLGQVRMGEWVEVAQGLLPGDRLIVSPTEDLADGQRIRLAEGENIHGSD